MRVPIIFVLTFCISQFGSSTGLSLETILSPLSVLKQAQPLSDEKFSQLLLFATAKKYNAFDLMNETVLFLKAHSLRISIQGQQFRAFSTVFRFGDTRIDTLFPIKKIVQIQLGASFAGEPELLVELDSNFSSFLEIGEFLVDKRYGFYSVLPKKFDRPFGIKVRNGLFSSDVTSIERVPDPHNEGNLNYIGINVFFVPKQKRWHIDPIRLN